MREWPKTFGKKTKNLAAYKKNKFFFTDLRKKYYFCKHYGEYN